VTASSAGAQPAATAPMRVYVEAQGRSIQSGIAIANPAAEPVRVQLDLSSTGGSRSATLELPAYGHTAIFLKEIPGFADLPDSLRGVLRISTSNAGGLSAVALRGRYNERGDFLISSTPPGLEGMQTEELVFPHLVDGGGYSTQFVLFNASGVATNDGSLLLYSRSGQPLALPLF